MKDASHDADLNDEKFEPGVTYSIYNASWTSLVDVDADGYNESGNLNIDVDVSSGTHSVYLKLYYKKYSSSTYTLVGTTSNFSITDASSTDKYIFGLSGFSERTMYDFKIEVYEAGGTTVKAMKDASHDADLNDEKFEPDVDPAICDIPLPEENKLYSAYPNPFNPSTIISYDIVGNSSVKLSIYNINGKLINVLVNEYQSSSNYSIIWDGCDNNGNTVESGMYFYILQAGDFVDTKKMVFMK